MNFKIFWMYTPQIVKMLFWLPLIIFYICIYVCDVGDQWRIHLRVTIQKSEMKNEQKKQN